MWVSFGEIYSVAKVHSNIRYNQQCPWGSQLYYKANWFLGCLEIGQWSPCEGRGSFILLVLQRGCSSIREHFRARHRKLALESVLDVDLDMPVRAEWTWNKFIRLWIRGYNGLHLLGMMWGLNERPSIRCLCCCLALKRHIGNSRVIITVPPASIWDHSNWV